MDSPSILEKVISSKKSSEIEQFHPSEVVSALFKNLLPREEDVLRRRFGLGGRPEETLEQIGEAYKVTRERIRQIESTAVKKLKKIRNFVDTIGPVENTISSVLEQHGGIMDEELLLRYVLQVAGDNEQNRRAVHFILQELLDSKFRKIKENKRYRSSWQLRSISLHLLDETIEKIIAVIREIGKPIIFSDLMNKVIQDPFFMEHQHQLTEDTIHAYLEVSQHIGKNPYGEYGLVEWGSITPRRMNDKIYLVLKKRGKPMHFSEITAMINDMNFDHRKAYPPTVHNELILNKEYVLIGRGIYALKEWGYRSGVVADVISDVLHKAERPMSRAEIVAKVLEQRIVKKNTIYLALTDKSRFTKNANGLYVVAENTV
ncbi:MAG: sigma factor-like helix-turn-helix DNA-binding protein [Patescibacteria group bacterium]|jgi:hypothetical protein